MPLSPEALYLQLGGLIAEMPDLAAVPPDKNLTRWLGRASVLIEPVTSMLDQAQFNLASEGLLGMRKHENALKIQIILHRALAKAELSAPAPMQGKFIAAGAELDAFAAVGRVLSAASSEILFVDPYADSQILTDFAVQAPERVAIRVLTGERKHKPTLSPAIGRWREQFGASRPLEVRLAPDVTLHDRVVVVDCTVVWALGQSLNNLASRAHTSIIKVDDETARLKTTAYEDIWKSAAALETT